MTLVRTLRTMPSSDGTRDPASGIFIWTPTKRRIVLGSPDEVVEPIGFAVELKDGYFEIDVAPTDANWVWRVDEKVNGLRSKTVYVTVPEVGPVDYTDLVTVNPTSFAPNALPPDIWYAYTDDLAAQAQAAKLSAQAVESRQIVDGTVNAEGDLIFTRNDGSTFNVGRVIIPSNLSIGIVETGP